MYARHHAMRFLCALCVSVVQFFFVATVSAQETPIPTPSPTTPPFVPTATPGNPEETFDSVFARFEASTQNPLTGEPFTLSLVVSLPDGVFIAEWPDIGGTWGAFEIREVHDIIENGQETRQDFTAVLWRPEDALTPETFIGYGAGGSDLRRVPVRELVFSVPTVLHPDDDTLRPPLPPFFADWPLPALVMIGGVFLAAGVVIWKMMPPRESAAPASLAQVTLEKLKAVGKRPPDMRFQAALALTRDLYARRRYAVLEPVITTGEALAYTGAQIDDAQAETFYQLALRAVQEAARE